MKFWKKIFIYSMVLFIIIFNGVGIFIIENIYIRDLNRTIASTIDEHKRLEGSIYLNRDIIRQNNTYQDIQLKNLLRIAVAEYFNNDKITENAVEFYTENDDLIFSNSRIKINNKRIELYNAKFDERRFLIRKINDKKYLFICSKIKIQEDTLKFILMKDINYIEKEKKENYNIFLWLDLIVLTTLGLGMYFISKKVTKPILQFSQISKEIAQGDYSKRAIIKNTQDEIGELANNFNIMVETTEKTIDELKDLNEAKQRFIDSLTHEFKTPLTSIIGYSDLLINGKINEEIKIKALNYINSEGKRLENLCSTLIKLILINKNEINLEKLSLNECIEVAYKSLSLKKDNNNLTIKFNVHDNIYVNGDKQLIIVLLINILDNAIKASISGSIIEIKSNLDKRHERIQLSIKDNGVGIPKNELDKIKEPFYMVDKARDRAKSGIGLGLSICDKICTVNNIRFLINSELNEGTEVILEFIKERSSL
ncbi:HAMP domain-containing sensor histidine kinase [Clostridium sp. Marseille-Q2269]|uniref:HAMP domain-containing sensor histidine kinase n=1 Tax=Clostridium sp. Marseille-Q2269 TaxID=2942205 RepID=UPI002072D0F2|nr:HAMP domain-containing sensor histidine kinase [Clostridium sp. Marseille-Q2269]